MAEDHPDGLERLTVERFDCWGSPRAKLESLPEPF